MEKDKTEKQEALSDISLSRRKLLASMGIAGVALAAEGLLAAGPLGKAYAKSKKNEVQDCCSNPHDSGSFAINAKPSANDFTQVQNQVYTIAGAGTAGTPADGYIYTPEIVPHFVTLNTNAGHNESLSGNGGRTGMPVYRTVINHAGQGDAVCFNGAVWIGGTKPGSTHWLANPAGVLINGDVMGGADGVYLNPVEYNMVDNGHDIAAVGLVINSHRTVGIGAKSAVWLGIRLQSVQQEPVDAGISLAGTHKVGLDFTATIFTETKAAVALKANDRIYLNAASTPDATGSKWYADTPGGTWIDYDGTGGMLRCFVENEPVMQLKADAVAATKPVEAPYYRVNGMKVVGSRQAAIADASGQDTTLKLNAVLAALRAHGLIAT
ncbi:hypothetical protein [Paenibacillus sp. GCM10027626]|uniref:hypothetical protein n=1 Tax=Paenibacillus sp. GCM10027626 TaxID=3273411 RepID=UPI0036421821